MHLITVWELIINYNVAGIFLINFLFTFFFFFSFHFLFHPRSEECYAGKSVVRSIKQWFNARHPGTPWSLSTDDVEGSSGGKQPEKLIFLVEVRRIERGAYNYVLLLRGLTSEVQRQHAGPMKYAPCSGESWSFNPLFRSPSSALGNPYPQVPRNPAAN